jgi:hypothetical protein
MVRQGPAAAAAGEIFLNPARTCGLCVRARVGVVLVGSFHMNLFRASNPLTTERRGVKDVVIHTFFKHLEMPAVGGPSHPKPTTSIGPSPSPSPSPCRGLFVNPTAGNAPVGLLQVAEGFSEVVRVRCLLRSFATPFEEAMFKTYLEP